MGNNGKQNKTGSSCQSLAISRTVADNILEVNPRNISKLQVVDENNNEIDKELIKPFLRGLKCNPQSYDFIVNLIQNIKDNDDRENRLERMNNGYLFCKIHKKDFDAFLSRCKDKIIRQTVRRQLVWNLISEFVISETKEEIRKFRPYYMYSCKMNKESGEWTAEIMFAESIFGGLITEDHGPKGFIYIPKYSFPKVTHTDKYHLESYNPIYRSIIYANMKNTNYKKGIKSIEVDLLDFLGSVLPEYLNKNNSLKVKLDKCEYSLNKALETLNDKIIKKGVLLNHLSFDKKEDRATLYYRLPRSA
jgi:hypothetical protein